MPKKILVVDDEKDVRESIIMVLEEAGHSVQGASSGEDALKKLKKDSKFDLALVDYFMPGMSGLALCEKIRKDSKLKNVKLAFLTIATFGAQANKEMKRLKILDYIRKPFSAQDFIKRVKKITG